jgi:hypothetical protein
LTLALYHRLWFFYEILMYIFINLRVKNFSVFVPRSDYFMFLDIRIFSLFRILPSLIFRMNVTRKNFVEILPKILRSIKTAEFVALDLEFTGLPHYKTRQMVRQQVP